MMVTHARMSPLTAFFIGVFGVGAVSIASVTAIVLYGLAIVDMKTTDALQFTEKTITTTLTELPKLLESLPEAIGDLLNDGRAPEYAAHLDVNVDFVVDQRSGSLRPVLTVVNQGEELVSLLSVRVAVLNKSGLPIRDWTEVIATPIAIDHDWRGPLMPGATRHVVLSSCGRGVTADQAGEITGAVEISDIRIWNGNDGV